jgi:DNA polymerase V
MIKVIASDMDGTLLGNDHKVAPETLKAIHEACDAGIRFMIATGRNFKGAMEELKETDIVCDYIVGSGAEVRDQKQQIVSTAPLSMELCEEIYENLKEFPVSIIFSSGDYDYRIGTKKEIEESFLKQIQLFHMDTGQDTDESAVLSSPLYRRIVENTKIISEFQELEESQVSVYKVFLYSNDLEMLARISKKLDAMGIKTVLDLADTDIRFIRKHFNVVLERTVRELRGEPCLQLEEFAPTKQEIICSRSFGERITDYPSMRQAICSYAARAAEKLRSEHQYCRFISTFIKTSPFALNEPYYGNSASVKLLTPTQDSRDIINAATRSLDAIWQAGHRYQKAGVMLGDFFSQGVAQLNLFDDNAPRPGSEQLMTVMDTLNAKEGRGTLYFAGQGIQQQWQMKRAMLSPRYTTRSSDLLRVK